MTFGEYRFDGGAGQLWRGDAEIRLSPRASALLAALAERSLQVVTKQELIDRLWDGKAVGDDALTSCVQELRRALGDDPRNPRVVETRHRRGYRMLLPVVPVIPLVPALPAAPLPAPAPEPDRASVAVLPFDNLSGDPEQEYFADGIAEDILTALARFPSLFVIARKSSFLYRGRAVDIRQVGRELGVRYVLEGSVRKAGGRVRITGQLIQADTGAHIWADRYDGEAGDVFALQDRITEAVVGALAPTIQRAEIERAERKPPGSLDAYDLYLRAVALYAMMTREANEEACTLLKRAIALDPGYAAAMALLGLLLDTRITQGWATAAEVGAEARTYARRALEIDKHNPDILAHEARSAAYLDGRHDDAIALIERALALNPNSWMALSMAGWIYVYAGRPEPAVVHLQRAMRLNPCDPADFQSWIPLAHAYLQLGRDSEALDAARQAVQRAPTYASCWRVLAAILALGGRLEEAQAAMATVLRLAPAMSLSHLKSMPTRSEAARARYFEGLRLAGMPEESS